METQNGPSENERSSSTQADSGSEWKKSFSRADSIGLLSILLGTLFIVIVPTVWEKATAFVLVCVGTCYFVWLSDFTYRLSMFWRVVLATVIVGLLIIIAAPQFVAQWRTDHRQAQLGFRASVPGIAYPDGDHYGIKWNKTFIEVRLTVISKEEFPIQNLELSIFPISKPGMLAGGAQTDNEPQGCVVRRPRGQPLMPSVVLKGTDGNRADITPYMEDLMETNWPVRDHYDLLCQRILGGESIPLVLAVLPSNEKEGAIMPSSQFRVKGSYETTPAGDSKRVVVDEKVDISTLPQGK